MILASLAGIAVFGYNALFVGWSPFPRYGQCGDEQPISVPFAVEKAGTRLTCEVVIEDAGSYGVYLSYFHNRTREDMGRIERIAGGYEYSESMNVWQDEGRGGPMIVHYILKSLDSGQILRDEVIKHPGIWSWDGERKNAVLGAFSLAPGRYEVTVESLTDAPEMATVRTDLKVGPYSAAK
jgi:hypothetical protein